MFWSSPTEIPSPLDVDTSDVPTVIPTDILEDILEEPTTVPNHVRGVSAEGGRQTASTPMGSLHLAVGLTQAGRVALEEPAQMVILHSQEFID